MQASNEAEPEQLDIARAQGSPEAEPRGSNGPYAG
jgi:hypothetical protein